MFTHCQNATLLEITCRSSFCYSTFSLLVFSDAGDSWSEEEITLQTTQQVLVSAMMGDGDERSKLPISTTELQQV